MEVATSRADRFTSWERARQYPLDSRLGGPHDHIKLQNIIFNGASVARASQVRTATILVLVTTEV